MSIRIVFLTDDDMSKVAKVAAKLHDSLRSRGVKDGHGARAFEMTRDVETGGAAAEMAVARYLKVAWTANGGDSYGADVGKRTQVRSSNKERRSHSLIVRQRDLDKYGNVPFVLVIQDGLKFTIKGWAMADEARTNGDLWDGNDSSRPSAYFLHESKLHPIDTLVNP